VVSSADLVQRFLCRLDPAQVESHRRALAAIDAAKDAAFLRIGEALRRGESLLETDVQAFLMERFAAADLETDHAPIVAVNGHAGDPHYSPSPEAPTPIRKGDLVLIDLWARGKGPRDVYADITWVGFCGERPPERLARIFGIAADARDAGLDALARASREGRTLAGFEVDRVVRGVVEAAGFGDRFLHRTGHSIETRVHGDGANLDDLETHDTRPLVPGLAFSIEPGIYLPEEGLGVRTEIDVFLADDGPKVFSPIQRELVLV
jgi:Xaa-Pro aminopeptidase